MSPTSFVPRLASSVCAGACLISRAAGRSLPLADRRLVLVSPPSPRPRPWRPLELRRAGPAREPLRQPRAQGCAHPGALGLAAPPALEPPGSARQPRHDRIRPRFLRRRRRLGGHGPGAGRSAPTRLAAPVLRLGTWRSIAEILNGLSRFSPRSGSSVTWPARSAWRGDLARVRLHAARGRGEWTQRKDRPTRNRIAQRRRPHARVRAARRADRPGRGSIGARPVGALSTSARRALPARERSRSMGRRRSTW